MEQIEITLEKLWEADTTNIQESKRVFNKLGILNLFYEMQKLFYTLHDLIAADISKQKSDPFIRKNSLGKKVKAWDLLMKMKMLVSADKEFFNATSSLFRGYITPMFPSVRRGTEAVGIAYLSKSKPEIADYFQNRDKKAFRQATTSDKILPRTDPLTVELKKVIDFAAEQSHNNYISFAGRLDEGLKEKNGRWCYEYTYAVHEVTEENFGLFVNVCLWTLRASGYVLSLFAQSLDLPENNEWYLRLSEFQSCIEIRTVELKDIIFGNFDADEGVEVDQVAGN